MHWRLKVHFEQFYRRDICVLESDRSLGHDKLLYHSVVVFYFKLFLVLRTKSFTKLNCWYFFIVLYPFFNLKLRILTYKKGNKLLHLRWFCCYRYQNVVSARPRKCHLRWYCTDYDQIGERCTYIINLVHFGLFIQ